MSQNRRAQPAKRASESTTTLANSSVLDGQMHVWFSHVFQLHNMFGESHIHKQAYFNFDYYIQVLYKKTLIILKNKQKLGM